MNVEDYELDRAPASRLAYARQAVRRALADLPCGSRVGLGAFAEYRTLLLLAPIEVCGNYNDLLASLDYLDGRMRWSNSSEITKGVFWSVRGAKQIGEGTQVIFLTDGQEAPPLRLKARPSFDDVKPGQVHGWIFGVGGYALQPIPKTDPEGNPSGYWRAEDVVQSESEAGAASREPRASVGVARGAFADARKTGGLRVRAPRPDLRRSPKRCATPASPSAGRCRPTSTGCQRRPRSFCWLCAFAPTSG